MKTLSKSDARHADMMIKVCGMSDSDNIRNVSTLYPMMMGFIFWRGSKRFAGDIDPVVVRSLPSFIRPVAVFVNESIDIIIDTVSKFNINIIQLHGDEPPEVCQQLKQLGYIVFKAIGLASENDFANLESYVGSVDLFVFDTKSDARGGTGKAFRRSILQSYPLSVPFLLSGGIRPTDAQSIAQHLYPHMVGIDINSRFENPPYIKDVKLLTNFILQLRKYNEYEPSRIPFWEKTK